jgi:hypothetical protein|tara:strand:+ start:496 stop:711 length:216 start_codon:yes stop_codon:yes gene_type:complete
MDLMVLSKLLFLVVVTLPDGSYDSNAEQVTECPPYEIVQTIMNYKLKTGEITSWFVNCNEYPFFETKKQPV